eukprot:Protomagalhaensia_sp_Gyna_25__733@NODE_134_length_4981_cov_115_469446_g106_i0_p3_GENE_NODE_134_length_4981_cov_115_469446_g106_i0NODE_134_length_4981_cov_115_469446_g106_i0_p3_ORF_typecomplete_len259_score21_37zfCCCH/PF00642_24/0_0012zfCCCH/PF00642_24/0_2zfCCCH/PF00642_24/1_1e05zfCCCH/PF00642_24/1_9e03zfCCCH_3/PF15663_5/1_7e05zfCCCH_3/PF15663_5/0_023zfCCCH_3/PF15663_5/1_4e04Torus/PF16131_5/0_0073Torus/PF16131_5/5e02Torus/PF16131_5/0_031zfCCCH_4/PF18044_1/5zfCCCH_4/PF18044_1/1_1e03zfCCCH_4/PF1804
MLATSPAQQQRKGVTNARSPQFYKTRMCPWYFKQCCDLGARCRFAHSVEELRRPPDLSRTSLCPRLTKEGVCTRPNCSYAHSHQELRATNEFFKVSLCYMWQKGRCTLGNKCRHAHGVQELRSPPVSSVKAPHQTPPIVGSMPASPETYLLAERRPTPFRSTAKPQPAETSELSEPPPPKSTDLPALLLLCLLNATETQKLPGEDNASRKESLAQPGNPEECPFWTEAFAGSDEAFWDDLLRFQEPLLGHEGDSSLPL